MSYWLIELVGNKKSLNFLSKYVDTNEISIVEEQAKTYLKVTNLEDGEDSTPLGSLKNAENIEHLKNLIEIVNGATTFFWPNFKKITFGDMIKVKDDGTHLTYRTLPLVFLRDFTLYSFEKGSQTLNKWISLSKNNPLVYKVFYLYSILGQSWSGLYMVLEVIVDDLGNWDAIVNQGWISKTELDLFKRTANSYGAVGHSARHASTKKIPPKKPINILEARKLVENIVKQWLSTKL